MKFIAIAPTRELSRVRGCRELSLLVEKFLLVESRTMGFGLKTVFDSPCVGRRKTLDRHVVPLAVKTVREESVNSNTDILFPLKKLNKNMEYLKIIECRLSLFFVTCRSDLSAGSVYIHSYTHNTTRDLPHSLVPLQLP